MADGLPSNYIYDICQDSNGYIWIGGTGGLSRYDGYSVMNFDKIRLASRRWINPNVINFISDSKNNLIWIKTSNYGYSCYDTRNGSFLDFIGKNKTGNTYKLFKSLPSGIWFYNGTDGVRHVKYANGKVSCYDYYNVGNIQLTTNVRNVTGNRNATWLITQDGLILVDSHKKTHIASNLNILDGACLPDGRYVFITANGQVLFFDRNAKLLKSIQTKFLPSLVEGRVYIGENLYFFCNSFTLCVNTRTFAVSDQMLGDIILGQNIVSLKEYEIIANSTGTLWIVSQKGEVQRLDVLQSNEIHSLKRAYNAVMDSKGKIYIATNGNGLFIFDTKTRKLSHYTVGNQEINIPSNDLVNVFVDKDDNIWLSSYGDGVIRITKALNVVTHFFRPVGISPSHTDNSVKVIMPTPVKDEYLVSTLDKKLYSFNSTTGIFKFLSEYEARVYAIHNDRTGRQWIGTRGKGVIVDGTNFSKSKKDLNYYIPAHDISDIVEDNYGRIWLATKENGILCYDDNGNDDNINNKVKIHANNFHQFLIKENSEKSTRDLEIDRDNHLWLTTGNGLYMLDLNKYRPGSKDLSDKAFTVFNPDNSEMPSYDLHCVFSQGSTLWVGGQGTGIVKCQFNAKTNKLTCSSFTTLQGIASNNVQSITADRHGNLWIGTEHGLSMLAKKSGKITTYNFTSSTQDNFYNEMSAILTPDGNLMFGTQGGLRILENGLKDLNNSKTSQAAGAMTNINITDFNIFNQSIINNTDENYTEMRTSLLNNNSIVLSHNQNTISLQFSTLQYDNISTTIYQYYLEGVDKDWNAPTTQNFATYTKLGPGTYTFHVRVVSGQGETAFIIRVLPPWWATWWAWSIYVLLIAVIIWRNLHQWRRHEKLRQQIKIDKQVNDFRLNFFTHIAHEFRTPLAIIQGAVEKIKKEPKSATAIQTAERGTDRLLRQVNQLLNFRKISTGALQLQPQQGDIIAFVRNIYQDFWAMAKQKNINYTILTFATQYQTYFDKDKVEVIIYNLISNAIKYTPVNGSVTVILRQQEDFISLIVEDNGNGISPEQEKRLFQPFMHGYVSQGGMGIGLYISQRMAELHKGSLTYTRLQQGSKFEVRIPNGHEDSYLDTQANYSKGLGQGTYPHDHISIDLTVPPLNEGLVIVIEDDPDMLQLITEDISPYFHVKGCMTGNEGLSAVIEHNPALVVCDVMLPDKNGYDIVRQIKKNPDTQHTPVIMLTALNDEQHQIKGYKAGVDDYLTKPCSQELLTTRILQLITWNKREEEQVEASPSPLSNQSDKIFLDKLNLYISQSVSDPTFTVDGLAEKMHLGRTKFYGKCKELTGMPPNKYLQTERMRIAAQLLVEGEFNVSEICYKVGISSPTYFYKCFKQTYGVPPSKYKG